MLMPGPHPWPRSSGRTPADRCSQRAREPGRPLASAGQIWHHFVQWRWSAMSVASEFEHAERVVEDVALLRDMAAGKLDERRVREVAEVLLEHRRNELPSVSVAVAARLLDVSRTTVEAWRSAGVLTPAVKHRRHEVTVDSLVRLQALISELRRLGRMRQLRDYVWWS